MRPYLSRSPVMAQAAPARVRPAVPASDRLPRWARSVLEAHVLGVDGWCTGCLAAGSCFLWPCPEVAPVLRSIGEPIPAGGATA